MDSIFIINENVVVGEDYSSRDIWEERRVEWLGYFTSHEAAQAWIDKQHEAERVAFAKKETDWETKLALWKDECENIDKEFERLKTLVQESGIRTTLRNPTKPYAPMRPTLVLSEYLIEEIEPEVDTTEPVG